MWILPNFARACGRVSIGGHPDKRPDSRPERDRDDRKIIGSLELRTLDRQPEAKPAHPVLHGGRGLKQRRSGLFWSLPVFHQPARATEEACSSLPRVRIGDTPQSNPRQNRRVLSPRVGASPSRVGAAFGVLPHLRAVFTARMAYGESAMTERIHDVFAQPQRGRALPRRRPRGRARKLSQPLPRPCRTRGCSTPSRRTRRRRC